MKLIEKYSLKGRVAIITGGAGLLGVKHAESVAEAGGIPVLWDINEEAAIEKSRSIYTRYETPAKGMRVDITDRDFVKEGLEQVLSSYKRVDILINNAATDPKVKEDESETWSRFENYPLNMWDLDIAVGLTGAFFCSQIVGTYMAKKNKGVILNISSDLGVISPDQRLYRKEGLPEEQQPVKPVTYSVVKHGLIGLTRYLATYWAKNHVRVNAILPGGIYCDQPRDFVDKLTNLIPMGRMADQDEYKAAVLFLISDASSYMTGSNLIIDGGRTCW